MPAVLSEGEVLLERFRVVPSPSSYPCYKAIELSTGTPVRVCVVYNAASALPRLRAQLLAFPAANERLLALAPLDGNRVLSVEGLPPGREAKEMLAPPAPPELVLPLILQLGTLLLSLPVTVPALALDEIFLETTPHGPQLSGLAVLHRTLLASENTTGMTVNAPLPSSFPLFSTEGVLGREGPREQVLSSLLAHTALYWMLGHLPYNGDSGLSLLVAQARGEYRKSWLPDGLWELFVPALATSPDARPEATQLLANLRRVLSR